MLRDGVIEPCNSPWSAPVVPVVKSDGSIRLCVDYRALNKATYKDSFPLPNIEDALYSLHGVEFFTTLDLIRGYYQVPMAESSKPYTAFSTAAGHWQFKRMPFGLCNAPATFQRLMGLVLAGFSWDRVMAYLDDILMMDTSFGDHLDSFDKLLACLARHGLKIKPQKCQLFRREVQFLGHRVSTRGLSPDPSNIQAILDFPVPRTVRQVHRFMGMVNFYRRFVPGCSVVARPLNRLLGSKTLQWTEECQEAFDKLREALTKPPILSYPDFQTGEPFQLFTDASNYGVGACLLQVQEGFHRVIAYISTTFNTHELNYSVLDKELAAIRWAVKRLKPFLWGHRFVIHSDHKPLSYLQSRKNLDSRLARMLEEMGEYDFEIRYLPGRCNVFADALSRAGCQGAIALPDPPDTYLALFDEKQVRGGADMLFRCFSLFLDGNEDDHVNLRQALVSHILKCPGEYNIEQTPGWRRRMRVIRCPGIMPVFECIQAFSNLIYAPVFVYETQIGFVRYEPQELMSTSPPCFIRSYDGVYFSLMLPQKPVDVLLECAQHPVPSSMISVIRELEDDRQTVVDPDIAVEFAVVESRQLLLHPSIDKAEAQHGCDDLQGAALAAEDRKRVRFDPVVVRWGESEVPRTEDIDTSWRSALNPDAIRDWQSASGQLRRLKELFGNFRDDLARVRRTCLQTKSLRKYARHVDHMFIDGEGLLVRRVEPSKGFPALCPYVVPFAALGEIVKAAHARNGHVGREKLRRLIMPYIFHPNLYLVVADVTKSCDRCTRLKPFSAKVTPPVLRVSARRPFELVSVDLMELPVSRGQHKYVMNAIDHHTKWLASQPLRNKTSEACASAFDRILSGLPGIPECVLSDNGLEFCGRPFVEMLRHYNVTQRFTTPYSPQCNGSVERVNASLIGILGGLCDLPSEWEKYLPEAVLIYNNTYHREIGRTPAESFTSVASRLPISPRDSFWKKGASSFEPYPVGSLVGRKILGPRGVAKKLSPRYDGPYVVERVHSNGKSYVLHAEDDPDRQVRAHYDQLRPWTRAPKYLQRSDVYRTTDVVYPDQVEPVPQTEWDSCWTIPPPGLDPAIFDLSRIGGPLVSPGIPPLSDTPTADAPGKNLGLIPSSASGSTVLGSSVYDQSTCIDSSAWHLVFSDLDSLPPDPDASGDDLEWDHLGFGDTSGDTPDFEGFGSGDASGSTTIGGPSTCTSSFEGFEDQVMHPRTDVGVLFRELRLGGSPCSGREPFDDGALSGSPEVWGASASPQVGDSTDRLGMDDETTSASSSSDGSYDLRHSDSSFSLPSLASAASGDSEVSQFDVDLGGYAVTPSEFGRYLTRAARARLFPEAPVEEALSTLMQ